jgi:LAO/AO transport system kinase
VAAGARLIRDLDDQIPEAIEVLKEIHPHTGRAHVVGVTGNPGAGKSTVVDGLITWYRAQQKSVGVIAIDPTSPFSGGAILGDRIRMQRHATDTGVFIRSMAARGHLGGLSRSAVDAIAVMDAMGLDVVLVETVGVGQGEVDIVTTAHTTAVVVVPGLGDEIQAIKAGIMEIADVLVINKADREGVERTEADLRLMLDLRSAEKRSIEIVKTVATRSKGIAELAETLSSHREVLENHHVGKVKAIERAEVRLVELLKVRLLEEVCGTLECSGGLTAYAQEVSEKRVDPYTAVDEIVARLCGRATS